MDVLGVTKGNPVPASQVVTPPVAGLANPPLVDLVTLLPADQRQSYVEDGSAQVLDHVLVTQDLVPTNTRLVYAHIDSDWPLVNLNDCDAADTHQRSRSAGGLLLDSAGPGNGAADYDDGLTLLGDGSYQVTVTVKNNGTGTAQGVKLTGFVLGSANGSPVPVALGDIQPGASASTTFVFPAATGAPGSATAERFTGIYTGGSFSGAIRATLPSPK